MLRESLDKKKMEREKSREFTMIWTPKPGEIIEGIVTEIGKTFTKFGKSSYIKIAQNGSKYLIFCNKVLEDKLEEEGAQEGDQIAIEYEGMMSSKRGTKYKSYIVVVKKGNFQN